MPRPQRDSQTHNERGRSNLSEHHRCWRNGEKSGLLEPAWPRQPDSESVFKIALAYLPSGYFASNAEIAIADGSFHKL